MIRTELTNEEHALLEPLFPPERPHKVGRRGPLTEEF